MRTPNRSSGISLIELTFVLALLISGWTLLSFVPWQDAYLHLTTSATARQSATHAYLTLLKSFDQIEVLSGTSSTDITFQTQSGSDTHISIKPNPTQTSLFQLELQSGSDTPYILSNTLKSAEFYYFNQFGESETHPENIRVIGLELIYNNYESNPYIYYIGLQ